jgi:acyl-CoA oxidase
MDLTGFVRGGIGDDLYQRLRRAIPADFFDRPRDLTLTERSALTYERFRHAGRTAPPATELLDTPAALCALLERGAIADPALFHVMLLHYTLVLAPILRAGNGLAEIRRRLESMESFGAVAMTEGGHSNSHLAPRTTAVYDPRRRDFVLSTPDTAAVKFPCTAGNPHVPKIAVVHARVVVGDEARGVFAFVATLRDATGAVPAGVRILPAPDNHDLPVDHAAIRFDGLRVPLDAWLAGDAGITEDGAFEDPSERTRLSKSMLTAPEVWRGVIAASAAISRASATALLRHSEHRPTAGRLAPGRPLLDHRSQQDALLTALANAYVLTTISNQVKGETASGQADEDSAWTPWTAVDRTLPLLKATSTTIAEETAHLCRTHSGAPGHAASDRLNGYRALAHAYLSAGGDNRLILFDVARSIADRDEPKPAPDGSRPSLSLEGCAAAARSLERRLRRALADRVTSPDSAACWDAEHVLAARTATARAERTVLDLLVDGPGRLRPLYHWFALDWSRRRAGALLDEGLFDTRLLDRIDTARTDLRDELIEQGPDLVRAFDLPELDTPPFWSTL